MEGRTKIWETWKAESMVYLTIQDWLEDWGGGISIGVAI